jgi:hypothetical protein
MLGKLEIVLQDNDIDDICIAWHEAMIRHSSEHAFGCLRKRSWILMQTPL